MAVYRRTFAYFRPFLPRTLLALGLTTGATALSLLKPWPVSQDDTADRDNARDLATCARTPDLRCMPPPSVWADPRPCALSYLPRSQSNSRSHRNPAGGAGSYLETSATGVPMLPYSVAGIPTVVSDSIVNTERRNGSLAGIVRSILCGIDLAQR